MEVVAAATAAGGVEAVLVAGEPHHATTAMTSADRSYISCSAGCESRSAAGLRR